MKVFRSETLRRIAALALLLAGGLIQAQTVFACTITGAQANTACCCEGENTSQHCHSSVTCTDANNVSQATPCCTVSVQIPDHLTASVAAPDRHTVDLLDAPQPPPAVPELLAAAIDADSRQASPPQRVDARIGIGSSIYLATQRFRL